MGRTQPLVRGLAILREEVSHVVPRPHAGKATHFRESVLA
jgi:hypothetical protein